jgi:hypothetical protein
VAHSRVDVMIVVTGALEATSDAAPARMMISSRRQENERELRVRPAKNVNQIGGRRGGVSSTLRAGAKIDSLAWPTAVIMFGVVVVVVGGGGGGRLGWPLVELAERARRRWLLRRANSEVLAQDFTSQRSQGTQRGQDAGLAGPAAGDAARISST